MESRLSIWKRYEKKGVKRKRRVGTNIMNMDKNTMQICTIFREILGQETLLLLMTESEVLITLISIKRNNYRDAAK